MKLKRKSILLALMAALIFSSIGESVRADIGGDTNKATNMPLGTTANVGKVASVNDVEINGDQFNNALAYQLEIAAIRGVQITDEQLPALQYQVLENLINQELIYQESRQYGINIDEQDIDNTYEERKQKANFETDAEFEEALKKSKKTVASYREEIKRGLALDRFIQKKFTDHTLVTDSEAKQYYDSNPDYFQQPDQVRVSHIMVGFSSDADQSQKDGAREKIEQVMERLKAGEDFAVVAAEVSENTNNKDNGGDLGYLSKGQLPQSFEDAAFALQKDELSDIVETDAAYHIIKLTDRKNARTVSFEEAKGDIVDGLKTSKVNSVVENYIKELKIKSTIVTYPISQ
jgi:peptidyl-prolyl cis-trans isomerase C